MLYRIESRPWTKLVDLFYNTLYKQVESLQQMQNKQIQRKSMFNAYNKDETRLLSEEESTESDRYTHTDREREREREREIV